MNLRRSPTSSGSKLDRVQKLFVFLMAAAGILVLAMAGATTVRALGLMLLGSRVEGVVVRQEVEEGFVSEEVRERDAQGDLKTVLRPRKATLYRAVVATTVQKRSVEIRALTAVPAPRYPDGSKVGVVYHAGRPEEGSLEPELRSPWGPLLGVIFGSALLGGAILILRVFR